MDVEFNILEKPLETDLSHEGRTKPMFLHLALSLVIIFLLPKSSKEDLFVIRLIISTLVFGYLLLKIARQREPFLVLIRNQFIGKLVFTDGPFALQLIPNSKIVIDKEFKGTITFKFEGYFGEVEGHTRNRNIYYGTKNQVIISVRKEKQRFYVFLQEKRDKRIFYNLIENLMIRGIEVKEYTRGERTFSGKKLNYQEIQELKNRLGMLNK